MYSSDVNYLGSSPRHMSVTKHLYKRYSGLNRTAYNHDRYYSSMLHEDHLVYALTWKVCFDVMFMIMGIMRSLARFQIMGIPMAIIFFILILLYTPVYMKKNYRKPSELF